MACQYSSRSVMSVVIILLALNYSTANCDQGNLVKIEGEKDVFLQSNPKFLVGRKMLQEMYAKPADLNKSLPEIQPENHHIQAQKQPQKPTSGVAKRDHSTGNAKDESEAFLDLMRKDYRGMARRKPPIHNHEPND